MIRYPKEFDAMNEAQDMRERTVGMPLLPVEPDIQSVDIIALGGTLYRKKGTILAFAVGLSILVGVASLMMRNQYTSSASFVPSQTDTVRTSAASALAGQLSAMGAGSLAGGSVKNLGDLYVGLLSSKTIADQLISQFSLSNVYHAKSLSDARRELAKRSLFDVGAKDSIVTISVIDKDPRLARDLVDAYLKALRDVNARLALQESSQRRLFFEQQLASEKDALTAAEVSLKKMQENSGLIAPSGQTEEHIQSLAQLRAQVAARQVQLAGLRQSSTEQNPEVVRLQSEIGALDAHLAQLENGENGGRQGPLSTSRVPEVQLEYVRAEREVKYHEALFDILSRQYETARIDEAHAAPLLQIVDQASMPDEKTSPHRLTMTMAALFVGTLVGSIYVVLREKLPQVILRQKAMLSDRRHAPGARPSPPQFAQDPNITRSRN